jgi:hypothetical protein
VHSGGKIALKRSKKLTYLAASILTFAVGSLLYGVSSPLSLFLLPVVLGYGLIVLRRNCFRTSPDAIVAILPLGDHWWLFSRSGQRLLVYPKGNAFRSPWMIIAHFKEVSKQRNITLVIANDTLDLRHYTYLMSRLWI